MLNNIDVQSMGQRMVVLNSTHTGFDNNTGTLHVSQVPPNPAIIAPGPALLFVVVNGVPSVGIQVMIGSGKIGPQKILPTGVTPRSTILRTDIESTMAEYDHGNDQAFDNVTQIASVGYRLKSVHFVELLAMWIILVVASW